jgi:hypothetical protein
MYWLERTSTIFVPLSLSLALVGCGSEGLESPSDETATVAQLENALSAAGSAALPRGPIHEAYREYLANRTQRPLALNAAAAQTLPEYAAECEAATGIAIPAFSCDNGIELPGQGTGLVESTGPCDAPNVLNGVCDPGSRFQVLAKTASAAVVAHCRRNGQPKDGNLYNDVAIIQYNKDNGAVCFYQALNGLDGRNVAAPSTGNTSFPWLDPAATHGIKCTGCHDNGGFIRSRYLAQVTSGPHALPSTADGFSNLTSPLRYVGSDYAGDRSWSVTAPQDVSDNGPSCTTCHRLAVNNLKAFGRENGTAAHFATLATAQSQSSKNPHSASSPIWMSGTNPLGCGPRADGDELSKLCARFLGRAGPRLHHRSGQSPGGLFVHAPRYALGSAQLQRCQHRHQRRYAFQHRHDSHDHRGGPRYLEQLRPVLLRVSGAVGRRNSGGQAQFAGQYRRLGQSGLDVPRRHSC